jgi:transcriptional regulator with XRE-family HTH domain
MIAESKAYQSLIDALRERRKDLGISQNDLDEIIGVTRGQVGKWEVGERKPRAFLLACWADALDAEFTIK